MVWSLNPCKTLLLSTNMALRGWQTNDGIGTVEKIIKSLASGNWPVAGGQRHKLKFKPKRLTNYLQKYQANQVKISNVRKFLL